MHRLPLLLTAFVLALTACSDDGGTSDPAGPDDDAVVPRGTRVLALDVKEGDGYDYMTALGDALDLGVQDVKQSFDWDLLAEGLEPGGTNWVDITSTVFTQVDCDVTLVLRPIDTVRHTYPDGIAADPLDGEAAVEAFATLLDAVHASLAGLRAQGKVGAILIGNEIDGYLGSDAARWQQFGNFLAAARTHLESLDWGARTPTIGAVIMAGGARDATIRALYVQHVLPHCDQATINYYALGAGFQMLEPAQVRTDLVELAGLFPDHTLRLQECGMSSGADCGSSEVQQAEFVTAVFEAWDDLADRITQIDFAWQTDVSDAQASQWVSDYGMSGSPDADAFYAYLRTLGLRRHDGTPKPAWDRLVTEAAARGW